jgi:hypothetical protein
MIKNILDLLQEVKGETENIRIAQGKYALPISVKNSYKLMKQVWKK